MRHILFDYSSFVWVVDYPLFFVTYIFSFFCDCLSRIVFSSIITLLEFKNTSRWPLNALTWVYSCTARMSLPASPTLLCLARGIKIRSSSMVHGNKKDTEKVILRFLYSFLFSPASQCWAVRKFSFTCFPSLGDLIQVDCFKHHMCAHDSRQTWYPTCRLVTCQDVSPWHVLNGILDLLFSSCSIQSLPLVGWCQVPQARDLDCSVSSIPCSPAHQEFLLSLPSHYVPFPKNFSHPCYHHPGLSHHQLSLTLLLFLFLQFLSEWSSQHRLNHDPSLLRNLCSLFVPLSKIQCHCTTWRAPGDLPSTLTRPFSLAWLSPL